jgi:hypothetical protein
VCSLGSNLAIAASACQLASSPWANSVEVVGYERSLKPHWIPPQRGLTPAAHANLISCAEVLTSLTHEIEMCSLCSPPCFTCT